MSAPAEELTTSESTFAVRVVRRRRKASGMSGAFDRYSMAKKAAKMRTESPRGSAACIVKRPSVAAIVNAYTRRINPAVTDGLFTMQAALPLGLSVLILAAFLAIEYRSKAPLMPLAFLRRRTTLTANVLSLVVSSSAGALIVLTVYLQGVLGYSPLDAGLAFLPAAAIFFFVGGWGSSWLMNRIGLKRVLIISTAFVTLGLAMLAPLPVAAGYLGILPGTILWSLGASIGFPALAIAGLSGTKPGEEGLASGLIQTSQRLGFPLGLSLVLTVASTFDPQLGLTGFRYAFLSAAVLSAVGLGIALRFRSESVPAFVERATPERGSVAERGEIE